jgi:hypothetical protein
MDADRQLSDEAAQLLAQYPGPIRLRAPIYRPVLGILVTLCIYAVGFWLGVLIDRLWLSFAILALGAFILFAGILGIAGGGYALVLDEHGFRRSSSILERQKWLIWNMFDLVPWNEASDFVSIKSGRVEFSRARKEGGSRWENYCKQALVTLPAFNLRSEELAALMNAWRERALSQQNRSA